jgi:hypothetical protein
MECGRERMGIRRVKGSRVMLMDRTGVKEAVNWLYLRVQNSRQM